jgi:hypothetical protein
LEKAMRRRHFILGIAGSAAAWPLAVRAQQPAMPVIGFLGGSSAENSVKRLEAFRKGLKPDTSKAATWQLNSAGPEGGTIECRHWRPIWSAGRWR